MSRIEVGQRILQEDLEWAKANSLLFHKHRVGCVNMISSPGAGKTTILTETINALSHDMRIGVIEGDVETDLDASRIRRTGVPAVQINTKGGCHLSAAQVNGALGQLPLERLDLIFIENVGNLVCPSIFDLGEHAKAVVLSTPEGDDKSAKYPAIFARSAAMLINKADLLACGALDFDVEKAIGQARRLNANLEVFVISAKTGQGLDQWCQWLRRLVSQVKILGQA
ncbi:MAG: hydrogenase nickel incorporation protein HypB [Sedimentisphaerales bacterium]|nr:hydrogenase nickel incorporation protein HypB [Sedimentisphaerales bacterium]